MLSSDHSKRLHGKPYISEIGYTTRKEGQNTLLRNVTELVVPEIRKLLICVVLFGCVNVLQLEDTIIGMPSDCVVVVRVDPIVSALTEPVATTSESNSLSSDTNMYSESGSISSLSMP